MEREDFSCLGEKVVVVFMSALLITVFLLLFSRYQSKRMVSSGQLYTYFYLLFYILTNCVAGTEIHEE